MNYPPSGPAQRSFVQSATGEFRTIRIAAPMLHCSHQDRFGLKEHIGAVDGRQSRSTDAWRSSYVGAKVLITGGLGLIGSTLARRLADFGSDVLVIDNLHENFGGNTFNLHGIEGLVKCETLDIRDVDRLRPLLRNQEFIFNLAAQTSHMDSMTAPFEDLEINCWGQLAFMECCREVNASARIVYASTRQIYGRPHYLPVDERHPIVPVDINGIHKLAAESYHLLYHRIYGLKTTVLRLTNTYGPAMRIKDGRQIFLGTWVRYVLEDRPFEVWGGQQRRDFTYADDSANALMAAASTPDTVGRAFNVGGSEVVSLQKLAETLIAQNGGGSFEIREFPAERKAIDIGDYYTDDRAFRAATGWAPQVGLAEGLKKTLDFYRGNLAHYV
jgi:UDP-glucose 4-epimerase